MREFFIKCGVAVAITSALGCAAAAPDVDRVDVAAEDSPQLAKQALTQSAYQLVISASRAIRGGQRSALYFSISDPTGRAVTRLDVEHTKLFHLIVVSRDLSYFSHLHPTDLGGGTFGVYWTPPTFDDEYHFYAQFKPTGTDVQTVLLPVHVPGTVMKFPMPLAEDTIDAKVSERNTLIIERPAGGFTVGAQNIGFMVHDSRTGAMTNDLGTYLGARAHIIAVKSAANGQVFIHGHDMGDLGGMGDMHGTDHESSGRSPRSSGTLEFDLNFESPGLYRLWVQYNRAGQNVTQSFTIQVGGSHGQPCGGLDNFVCGEGETCDVLSTACEPSWDDCEGICVATTCDYTRRNYTVRSVDDCARTMMTCAAGFKHFSDSCGCGCDPIAPPPGHDGHH